MPRTDSKTRSCAPLRLAPMLLLAGCATTLPPSGAPCPEMPDPPVAQRSPPATPYSETAAKDIETWRAQLTTTPPTPGSASQDGRGD